MHELWCWRDTVLTTRSETSVIIAACVVTDGKACPCETAKGVGSEKFPCYVPGGSRHLSGGFL